MQAKTFNRFFKNGFNPVLGSIPRLPLLLYILDDDGLAGSHSGECGCIAGPKYPDLDTCDV